MGKKTKTGTVTIAAADYDDLRVALELAKQRVTQLDGDYRRLGESYTKACSRADENGRKLVDAQYELDATKKELERRAHAITELEVREETYKAQCQHLVQQNGDLRAAIDQDERRRRAIGNDLLSRSRQLQQQVEDFAEELVERVKRAV
jgi:chromosome segregation ATPase